MCVCVFFFRNKHEGVFVDCRVKGSKLYFYEDKNKNALFLMLVLRTKRVGHCHISKLNNIPDFNLHGVSNLLCEESPANFFNL